MGIVRDCGDFELTASSSYSLRWKAPPKDEAEREARAALAAKLQGGSIEINRLREQQESSLLDLVMRTVDANEADVEERIKRRERRRAELREREEKGRARKQAIRDGRRVAADRG